MDVQTLPQVLLSIMDILCLTIAIRAFYFYARTHNDILFTLGLSMGTIAVSAFSTLLIRNAIPSLNGNAAWIKYVGPTCSFLFIFLNSLARSGQQIRILKRWHILCTAFFLTFLLLTPALPPFSSPGEEVALNTLRGFVCLLSFIRYMMIYTTKETRFSLFMCLAFMLFTISYATLTPQLFDPHLLVFYNVGTGIRIIGYGILLTAFSIK